MQLLKNYMFLLCVLLSTPLFSVGGLTQKSMINHAQNHPGVALLDISYKYRKGRHLGTAQLLPHSQGLLAVTAKHCVKDHDGGLITLTFDDQEIEVVEIFNHPNHTQDIALLRLAKAPAISDDLLPQFPTMDFLQQYENKRAIGTLVGFGQTSNDNFHPAFFAANNNNIKRAGEVHLSRDSNLFSSRELVSQPWSFTATLYPQDRVFAGPGDSGAPFIIDNTLAGILVSSPTDKDHFIEKSIFFISSDDIKRHGDKLKFIAIDSCCGHPVSFYLFNRKIYALINQEHLSAEKIKQIKDFILNNISFYPPWEMISAPHILNCFLENKIQGYQSAYISIGHAEPRFSHIDEYVNISKSMNFITAVYRRCGFPTDFADGFAMLGNLTQITLERITAHSLGQLSRSTQNKLPLSVDKAFGQHLENYIRGSRARGHLITEFSLLASRKSFHKHIRTYLKAREELETLPQKIEEIDMQNIHFMPSLQDFSKLKKLSLTKSSLAETDSFETLTTLKHLNLSETLITSLASLTKMTKLKEIILDGCPISDLSGIENLPTLKKISLRDTNVTNLEILRHRKKLVIDLRGCQHFKDQESVDMMTQNGCYILQD